MKEFLRLIQSGESLTEDQMLQAMTKITNGSASNAEIAGFLVGLSERGETVEEIVGAAKFLRAKANTIKSPPGTVDCCGTGGDNSNTFNISTAVALVAGGAGVPVAKHGNRASTSKSGAADVLENLGVNLNMPKEALELALEKMNFAFLMAPHHHPAMKNVSAIRKKLGVKTIFNLLGPLVNPARTKMQLVGVYDKKWIAPIAEALRNLGSTRAWIVHGSDGLDEITLTGPTSVAILDNNTITMRELEPGDFDLIPVMALQLKGGDAAHNASALRKLLNGEQSPYRDIVLANAAAVLCIHGKASDLKDGVKKAAESIDGKKAQKMLSDYINFSREIVA